jgi:hypothetical protein
MRCETSSTPTAVVHLTLTLINHQSSTHTITTTTNNRWSKQTEPQKNETKIFVAKGEKSNVAALSMIDDDG